MRRADDVAGAGYQLARVLGAHRDTVVVADEPVKDGGGSVGSILPVAAQPTFVGCADSAAMSDRRAGPRPPRRGTRGGAGPPPHPAPPRRRPARAPPPRGGAHPRPPPPPHHP